ncbi:hypothetical protein J6590_007167 [Homalodisca vitripennis]|nr:hypothetical protein J6590_007167 [Homalodisca vitripennis]
MNKLGDPVYELPESGSCQKPGITRVELPDAKTCQNPGVTKSFLAVNQHPGFLVGRRRQSQQPAGFLEAAVCNNCDRPARVTQDSAKRRPITPAICIIIPAVAQRLSGRVGSPAHSVLTSRCFGTRSPLPRQALRHAVV